MDRLLIVVASAAAALLAAEILTRLVYSRSDFGRLMSFGGAPSRSVDGVVLWDNEALRYDRDELRRGPSRRDAFTVVGLGDSIMYGVELPNDATYLEQAKQILAARSARPVEVFNLAVPGYNSAQQAAVFKETVPHVTPDLVIVHWWGDDDKQYRVIGNHVVDFGDLTPDGRIAGQALPIPAALSERLLVYSRLYALLTHVLVARHQPPRRYDWGAVTGPLADIHARAQRAGARLLILISPELSDATPHAPAEVSGLREFAAARGIEVIDLSDWLPDVAAPDIALDSCHFNADGHRRLGQRLAEYLLARDLSASARSGAAPGGLP